MHQRLIQMDLLQETHPLFFHFLVLLLCWTPEIVKWYQISMKFNILVLIFHLLLLIKICVNTLPEVMNTVRLVYIYRIWTQVQFLFVLLFRLWQ